MNRKFGIKALLLGVFAIAILLIGGSFYLSRMQKSLWEQSVNNVLEVTVQGGKSFEVYMDQGDSMLEGRAANFAQYDSADPDGIGKKLDLYEEGDPSFDVLDLTNRKLYYNSKEKADLTEDQVKEYLALPERGVLEPHISEATGQRVISLYMKFKFADGGQGMVRRSVLLPEFAKEFSLSFYDGAGFSYIVNSDGDIMLRSKSENGNRTFNNVFDVVALDDNTESSVDAFREGIAEGKRGVMRLNFDGKKHIFAFVPLESTEGWYLVSVVPDDTITEHADHLLMSSQVMIGGIAAAIIVFMIIMWISVQHQRLVRTKETEVRYREQFFNLLAKNTNDVFLMLTDDYSTVKYVSPNIERVMGISKEDVVNDMSCLEEVIYGMEYEEEIDISLDIPIDGSTSFPGKYVHKVSGETRWFVETVYHTVIDNTERYIVILSDRTEERQKEITLTEALEIAKVANESKSTFLANMSHDIRTPMNAIVGLTTLLQRDAANPEKVREHTGKIASSSQHLLGLINDVLDMSKIETGKTSLNVGTFNLPKLVQELDSIIRLQAKAKMQTFDISVQEIHHENLIGDKQRISQVLVNILSNAVKYTPEGGCVTLSVRQPKQVSQDIVRVQFVVTDNGIGMSEEYQQVIFQPFTREIRTTVNQIQGTGLGMAITKNLVEIMGGTISVESEQGKGSTFTIEFDLKTQSGKKTADAPEEEPSCEDCFAGRRFLCAEDNELNAEILCELLQMMGAGTDMTVNGQEALKKFSSEPAGTYDAVLMDIQMPIMDGYEAARAIRELDHPEAASIPIVAMTANAFADDVRDALEAGMNAHIAKPIDMKILVSVLTRLWSGKK